MRTWIGRALLPLAAAVWIGGCERGADADRNRAREASLGEVEEQGPPVGVLPEGVSAEAGREGRRLYSRACVMCHGERGEGTQLGPSLVDGEWTHAEGGGYAAVVEVVRAGVPEPAEFPVPMTPAGDGTFTDDEIRAVAAYAWSLAQGPAD